MKTTHPNIVEEWAEQNFPLQPDEVNAKSRKNVWWHCKKCGNEWKSVINARVKGTVCPVCAERAVRAGYNDLATTNSELLVEWDYELNKLKPTEVSRSSAKRAWWKCRYGHSWSMKIVERAVLGKGCRECEQEYRSLFPAFAISYYAKMKGLKIELGSDRLLGIPIDVYIPSEQVTIEVNLGSEKIETLKEHLCKQRDVKLITLSKGFGNGAPKLTLKWNQVEKRIGELIRMDRYLNPKEKEQYPKWLEKQEERRAELAEQQRNREILSAAPPETENNEVETEARYEYHLGDTVYIGASEYEI